MTDKHDLFKERYDNNDAPWDTNITPPEIVAIAQALPTGKTLDVGCGTGTTMQFLLSNGWQVDGVDFVQTAIDYAQDKLRDFDASDYRLFCHDVTQLDALDGLRAPYDLVIDIGCGHGIDKAHNVKYAHDLAQLMRPDGTFMLYTHQPREDTDIGWSPDDVRRLFSPYFVIESEEFGDDTSTYLPAIWYRMVRKSDAG